MGDEVKDEPAKPKETKSKGKAGWLKKSTGKFLGSYKDRYIQLEKTEIAVYENEDLKNCVERLDLENYDKCHELRSAFKKKYRLILIRSPNSTNRVCDIKLQAQNQEEKEDWIKVLSDGINRARNKIFDEVKVDEGLSLEHVTRSRPKGNRSRRPPTRIHMKEAADISSDGILRLDLDPFNNMPNGAHFSMDSADGKNRVAPAKSFDDILEETAEEDTAPQKKVLKPPMPPSKENKLSESQNNESKPEDIDTQKKILKPPMPPSKEQKPSESTKEGKGSEWETVVKPPMPPSKEQKPSESTKEGKGSEWETVVKPPMPPSKDNKPRTSASASEDTASDNGESETATTPDMPSPDQGETETSIEAAYPPSPPSKDIKSKQPLSLSGKEILSDDEGFSSKDKEEDEPDSTKTDDKPCSVLNIVLKPQGAMWDSPSAALEKDSVDQTTTKSSEHVVTTITLDLAKPGREVKLTPHSTPEVVKKSAAPPAPPKKKPFKLHVKTEDHDVQDNPVESTVFKLPVIGSASVKKGSEIMPSDETKDEAEVKSIDSGQLSAEDSESSEQVTPSTDKLQSSLEVLDGVTSEEELEALDSKVQKDPLSAIITDKLESTMDDSSPVTAKNPETPKISRPAASLNTSMTKRSVSTGDLLEEMTGLQKKVSVELEQTGELLGKISPEARQDSAETTDPEILLTTAMEKLKKAEKFLKEAKCFKEQDNKSNRTSW